MVAYYSLRIAKRYRHTRPEAQRQALEAIPTALPENGMGQPKGAGFREGESQNPPQVPSVNQLSPCRPVAQPG